MGQAERLYLTEIDETYEGDTFFPPFEDKFDEIERESHDQFDFVTYRKKRVE
jgi:dihydrofolate reductase